MNAANSFWQESLETWSKTVEMQRPYAVACLNQGSVRVGLTGPEQDEAADAKDKVLQDQSMTRLPMREI